MEEPDQYIDFMAKYRDWISIKRMGIRDNTRPEEVVFHLAGIRGTIDSKAFPILGIKISVLDSFADEATKGLKKNANSLAEVAQKFGGSGAKTAIDQACDDKQLKPLAEIYLLGKMIANTGYDTSINQKAMSKIWKDLKVKKPPGRGAGKKAETPA